MAASFGYYYSETAGVVSAGGDIEFDEFTEQVNLTPESNGTVIRVLAAGVYRVSYGVTATLSADAAVALYRNGVQAEGSLIALTTSGDSAAGEVLLALAVNDTLELRVTSGSITLISGVNAYLSVTQIA